MTQGIMEKEKNSAPSKWHENWQKDRHAVYFDGHNRLNDKNLIRQYESWNDVRLLLKNTEESCSDTFLEVGCATGELYRYLSMKRPSLKYNGVDISKPAIGRAKEKYPQAHFSVINPGDSLSSLPSRLGMKSNPDIVFCRDVAHHQPDPFTFIDGLISIAGKRLSIRTRTRDVGATERNPENSCQYHYGEWVPFIVMNLEELTGRILKAAPDADLTIYRNHIVLGGQVSRFLPKDCYLPETGTAETAFFLNRNSATPGRVIIQDIEDLNVKLSWDYYLSRAWQKLISR